MPKQIAPEEVTDELLNRTSKIIAVRSGNKIKYKLRTPRTLYTVVYEEGQDADLLDKAGRLSIPVEAIAIRGS